MADQLNLNVGANTTSAQASMGQLASLTEAQMKRIAAYIKTADDAQARMSRTVKDAANSDSYQKIAEGAKKVEGAHAGVNRELLVLAHEMSQGNYSRFGGSLLVLGERMDLLSKLTSPAGVAIGALAAIVGGAAIAMGAGAIQSEKFSKALQLTGNYAAVTSSQIKLMADAQAHLTGQTPGNARTSLEAVAGSGRFGTAELSAAARALGDYQKVTGESADSAIKNFERIQDGVAKWAEEENKSVHFLTLAQYEHIKAMEDAGDKQGAAVAALTAYAQAIESRGVPSLGILARAWNVVTDGALAFKQAMMDIGRPDTLADKIADAQRQIQWDKSGNAGGSYADRMRDMAEQQAKLAALMAQSQSQTAALEAKARQEQAAQEAIAGKAYEESVLRQAHALSERTKELEKWAAQRDKDKSAGTPMSDADYKAGVSEINKRYENHSGDAQANQYRSLEATIKAYNVTTDEQSARVAKVTEGQRFLIQVQEELAKSGDKLTSSQKASILLDAQKAAGLRDLSDQEIRTRAASLARIVADTANQEKQQSLMEGVVQAGNDQANAILRQSELIGKSADEVTKIKALQTFDDLVGKALLGADGETVKKINQVADTIRGNLVSALDQAKAKQDAFNASYASGFASASQDYIKQSDDNAAHAQKVFTDAVGGMTNALATFAETGKLSFKGLINSMIDDLIRLSIQKGFANVFGQGGSSSGGWLSSIGGLFDTRQGAAGLSGTGSFADLFSSGFGGSAYAGGIDSVPYNGMPAILHEGERVMTRIENQRSREGTGGITIHIDQSGASYGAGVDAAGVQAIAQAQAQRAKAEIYRELNTGARR